MQLAQVAPRGRHLVAHALDRDGGVGAPEGAGHGDAERRGERDGAGARAPRVWMQAIVALLECRLAMGLSPTAIARELRVSRGTVYKARADMTDIA